MFLNCLDQRKIFHRSSNQEVIFIINKNIIITSISTISIFRGGKLTPMLTLGVAHVEF